MPQLTQSDEQYKLYGQGDLDQRKPFRQRLMDRFAAHEWVRVINLDDETFFWQYMPAHAESFEFTPDPMKITSRDDPEAWMLGSGESEVIIGENAYVMIEALYKKLVTKGYLLKYGDNKPGQAGRNFNFSDAKQQEDLINRIYLGKENPKFNKPAAAVVAEARKELDAKPDPRPVITPGRLRTSV